MKANFDLIDEDFDEATPVVHIISDSLGDTASEVVNAAAGQFPNESVRIERLAKVTSVEQVRHYFDVEDRSRDSDGCVPHHCGF